MYDTLDIFISYKREERETAAALAERLEDIGYRVYYDVRLTNWTANCALHDSLSFYGQLPQQNRNGSVTKPGLQEI